MHNTDLIGIAQFDVNGPLNVNCAKHCLGTTVCPNETDIFLFLWNMAQLALFAQFVFKFI